MHRSIRGEGNLQEVAALIKEEIFASAFAELIQEVTRETAEGGVCLLVFEKYYMRASNRASLTVLLTQSAGSIVADIIGSGGGQGAVFRFSWGSEEDFVSRAVIPLKNIGFRDI